MNAFKPFLGDSFHTFESIDHCSLLSQPIGYTNSNKNDYFLKFRKLDSMMAWGQIAGSRYHMAIETEKDFQKMFAGPAEITQFL